MMTGEAASIICSEIAKEVRVLRLADERGSPALNLMLEMLPRAPSRTAVDVLALVATSHKLLTVAIGVFQDDEIEDSDDAITTAEFALILLKRSVETLETYTGFGAEGFTGEIEMIN